MVAHALPALVPTLSHLVHYHFVDSLGPPQDREAVILSAPGLFLSSLLYLFLLFLVAYATEKRWIPPWLPRHPAVYILSLGVYATTWSFYGSVGYADSNGFMFLAVYLGLTFAFILTPVLLSPILRLVREYQLTSLADLFAFRFRSQTAGVLVTIFMLAGTLPYLSLQIRAVTESASVLTQQFAPQYLSLGFCTLIVLFTILFGARHIAPREKHEGLVVAIALESLVKLLALILVAGIAVFGVFGGFGGLADWLDAHPEALEAMTTPAREGPWVSVLILAFAASFLLPRQFHMLFTENISPGALIKAAWGFPLFLLILNLAIPVILWAAVKQNLGTVPDYHVLGIAQQSGSAAVTIFVFLGGVSAASAMIIVSTLALAGMTVNHLILPTTGTPGTGMNLYRWLLWGRRIIIAVLVFAGYGFFLAFERSSHLVQLGLISFVAVAQFLPGIAGTLFWPGANRNGFIAGLAGGGLTWFIVLILPLLIDTSAAGSSAAPALWELAGQNKWTFSTLASLSVNAGLFVLVSVLTRQSSSEREAAALCAQELLTPYRSRVRLASSREFAPALAGALGTQTAEYEVRRAQRDLKMREEETEPRALGRLRERIERNLSGLIGPYFARDVVELRLPIDRENKAPAAEQMRLMEDRLEVSRSRLRGLAAQLDTMRRYHRQILEELPVGVCSVSSTGMVTTWNRVMEHLSGISKNTALDSQITELTQPWGGFLEQCIDSEQSHIHKQVLEVEDGTRWFGMYKTEMRSPRTAPYVEIDSESIGTTVLLQDLTEIHQLESQLAHSERLASIGRFASGVAHEIGNPVTGIACLAQNLESETSDPEIYSDIQGILEQTSRINNIVQTLVNFSRRGEVDLLQKHRFGLRHCLEEAEELVRLSRPGKTMDVVIDCSHDLDIEGDRQRLCQVFVNILSNGYDASNSGGIIQILADQDAAGIQVKLRDYGHGMADEISERIFEPFVTTKQPGEGSGLGMALTYGIIRDHDGHIEVDSAPDVGTEVRITLPLPA
ncbi:MAG TPA: histidine kinase [Gammaproteobacteria bacterium]|nr:histidine kinase [Acidiferrobacteraceae bacterium]HCX86660.1 histidine kinase [Gammaproteobacteria bacterium]